ncbi:anti-sigma factor [Paenibacillus chondroitinus]|uniref:Anti-sigma factor n=1 Tax=Paenibacillus chondroitinus TaxID=59842 RepID=A0ABU6DIE5_9BACL|nr:MULTISPECIES: anti-sigma factor [Paenibacillus]MCY9663318.1 anti-sigma factor [Paenibacillus anseongense]MEB4796758.1 anti-sigma factor [Paenibacillus chondroitinus]
MNPKQQEDIRLTQYLNKLLDEMPLNEPSPLLTDRIMRAVQADEITVPQSNWQAYRRKAWVNGLVATAATILLFQLGIIHKIINIDVGIIQITSYIQHLSELL